MSASTNMAPVDARSSDNDQIVCVRLGLGLDTVRLEKDDCGWLLLFGTCGCPQFRQRPDSVREIGVRVDIVRLEKDDCGWLLLFGTCGCPQFRQRPSVVTTTSTSTITTITATTATAGTGSVVEAEQHECLVERHL